MLLKDDNLKFIKELKDSPQGGDEPYASYLQRLEKALEREETDQRLVSSVLYRLRDAMELSRARELIGNAVDDSSLGGLGEAWVIVHERWSAIDHTIQWDMRQIEGLTSTLRYPL